jgi:hypothetical protein
MTTVAGRSAAVRSAAGSGDQPVRVPLGAGGGAGACAPGNVVEQRRRAGDGRAIRFGRAMHTPPKRCSIFRTEFEISIGVDATVEDRV